MIVVKYLKTHGFGEILSANFLKQVPSNQKHFILYLYFKLSLVRAKDRVNLNIFTVALFKVCYMMHCIVLTVQFFYLRRNKDTSVLLSTIDKRVAMKFHENQRLNPGNQYHKDPT